MMASFDAVPAKNTRDYKKILPWLGLLAIVLAYALCVLRSKPTNFFGLSEDDSIYFASAHALAEGLGEDAPRLRFFAQELKETIQAGCPLVRHGRGRGSFSRLLLGHVLLVA